MGVSGQVKPFSNLHALVASKFFFCSSYKYTTLLVFSSVSNLPFLSNYAWCLQQHISKTFSFSFRYHLWLCLMFLAYIYIYTYICCDPFINPFYWTRCIFFEEQFERFIILINNYFFSLFYSSGALTVRHDFALYLLGYHLIDVVQFFTAFYVSFYFPGLRHGLSYSPSQCLLVFLMFRAFH